MISGSSALVFTQRHFDEYARLSGDNNPIHVDPAFAAATRFGRPVAHGMLLFSSLQAALARRTGEAVRLQAQEFIFSAPTFTGDPLLLHLKSEDGSTVTEEISDSTGKITTRGVASLGEPNLPAPGAPELVESGRYKGLEVGMTAGRSRGFDADQVAEFVDLVRDPNPLFSRSGGELPPGLLAGLDSSILGVDLPGPGTNWLKQSFWYHRPVRVPAEVTCTVTVTRIRPDKGLINLATRSTVDDEVVVSGVTLVLAVDVADPPPVPA